MLRRVKALMLFGTIVTALSVVLLTPIVASAAEYPEKRIRLVVPFGPGGGADAVALRIQKAAKKYTHLPIDITYMPGGAGVVGSKHVVKADPAHPLPVLVALAKFISLPPPQAGYTAEDFEWIAQVGLMPIGVVVPPKSDMTFADLVKKGRENPTALTAGAMLGGVAEIWCEMLQNDAHVGFKTVPYNGVGEIMLAVMGGHLDFGVVSLGPAVTAHKNKSARMIAVSHAKRLDNVPDVPTASEVAGVDLEFSLPRAIFTQKGISPEAKAFLEDLFEKIVSDPTFIKETEERGEVAAYRKGVELETFLKKRLAVARPFLKKIAERGK